MEDFDLEMLDEGRDEQMPDHDYREQDDDPMMEYQDEVMDELARRDEV
jgi:hypothetical protein